VPHNLTLAQAKFAERRSWTRLLQALQMACERVARLAAGEAGGDTGGEAAKRRRTLAPDLLAAWAALRVGAESAERQVGRPSQGGAPVFAFAEGALVAALRDGSWLLLDEVNLAPAETLERLSSVMEVRLVRCRQEEPRHV